MIQQIFCEITLSNVTATKFGRFDITLFTVYPSLPCEAGEIATQSRVVRWLRGRGFGGGTYISHQWRSLWSNNTVLPRHSSAQETLSRSPRAEEGEGEGPIISPQKSLQKIIMHPAGALLGGAHLCRSLNPLNPAAKPARFYPAGLSPCPALPCRLLPPSFPSPSL